MKIRTVTLTILMAVMVTPGALAQDWAKPRLEKSRRHGEWVDIKSGERTIKGFVVYPEKKEKTPVIIVIHEIFGLTEWVRGLCDQLAEAGYIAIAPDLLSGKTFSDVDGARKAIGELSHEQIGADLDATFAYVQKIPAGNGKIASCGFCWGGSVTFAYANSNPGLNASYSFYGSAPEEADKVKDIACPVYGFYAENDERVNATIPKVEQLMKAAGKKFEPVFYKGAGHGFMRQGDPDFPGVKEADKKAREDAWARWKKLLAELATSK